MEAERRLTPEIRHLLDKEIPYLTAEIRYVFKELDREFHLHGAKVPITFGYDTELLGSYTPAGPNEEEHFHFSLLFIGHAMPNPLQKEDRLDLFRHEYAHYMVSRIEIPDKYRWQAGKHGSAWKYCCFLVGAAPTPFYKAGEALMKHDYDKVLVKKERSSQSVMLDNFNREREYKARQNSRVVFKVGDQVDHPSFGKGTVKEIRQQTGAVRLVVAFKDQEKVIDQQWLLRQGYGRAGDK